MEASKLLAVLTALSLMFAAQPFAEPAQVSEATDRAKAIERLASWRPATKRQCRKSCGKVTNCYPGECYAIGEELRCEADNCVTRNACETVCQ
jgi:hypothetical protein